MVGEAAKLPKMVWEAPKRPKTPAFCIFSDYFWDILGARNGRGGCQNCPVWKAEIVWRALVREAAKLPKMVWEAPKSRKYVLFAFFSDYFGTFWAPKWSGKPKKSQKLSGTLSARARVHVCVHACLCVLVRGNGLEGLHVVWEALSGPSKYPEILRLGAVGLSCWRGDSALVFLDAACFIVLQCARASVPGETSRLLRTGARSFVAACLRACASGPQPRGQVWRAELTKAQGNGEGLVMQADDQASFVARSTNRFHIASDAPKVLGVKFISDLLRIRR